MTMRDMTAAAAPMIAVDSDVERRPAGSHPLRTLFTTGQESQARNGLDPEAAIAARRCSGDCGLCQLRRVKRG